MYGAYLSYGQVREYIEFLQSKGLLSYEEGTSQYRLTEKGLQFMGVLEEINDAISLGDNNSFEKVVIVDKISSAKSVAQHQW